MLPIFLLAPAQRPQLAVFSCLKMKEQKIEKAEEVGIALIPCRSVILKVASLQSEISVLK